MVRVHNGFLPLSRGCIPVSVRTRQKQHLWQISTFARHTLRNPIIARRSSLIISFQTMCSHHQRCTWNTTRRTDVAYHPWVLCKTLLIWVAIWDWIVHMKVRLSPKTVGSTVPYIYHQTRPGQGMSCLKIQEHKVHKFNLTCSNSIITVAALLRWCTVWS